MRLSQILKISRLEVKRNRSLAKKDFLVTIIPTLIVFGIIIATMVTKGFFVGDSFYRASTNDPNLKSFLNSHPKFILDDDYDVQILSHQDLYFVDIPRSDRGKSALYTLYTALKDHNAALYGSLSSELAHPFLISTEFIVREIERGVTIVDKDEYETNLDLRTSGKDLLEQAQDRIEQDNIAQVEVSPEGSEIVTQQTPPSIESEGGIEIDSGTESGSNILQEPQQAPSVQPQQQPSQPTQLQEPLEYEQPKQTFSQLITREVENARPPGQLNTLHSFLSMYKAMLLIFPLTMIGIIYSNSLMSDRINRRIHVLLSAPVSTLEIIIGKTLPYLGLCVGSMFTIAIRSMGFSVTMFLILGIAMVVAFLYCAIAFTVSMLARDSKELSFFMIFFLSMYSFILLIPTFLSSVTDMSLISPLTLIARLFEQGTLPLNNYLTLIPHLLLGIALFAFGAMLHNEENMLSYRTISQKFHYSLSHIIRKPWHLAVYCAAIVPLAFIIEMVMLLFLIGTPVPLVIMVLAAASFTEEALKCVGYWAVARTREMSNWDTIKWGFMGGLGFFLIEKASYLITVTELIETYSLIVIGGLAIPLMIHVGLGILFFALLKKMGPKHARNIFWIVTLVHFLINLNVVRYLL